MAQNKQILNRVLALAGFGQLDDPGLPAQIAYLIEDHDHLRSLLTACTPEERGHMYEALAPNLRFKPLPLESYMIEARRLAERLPVWDSEQGKFVETAAPDIRTAQAAVNDAFAKGSLELVCRKCTRSEVFPGEDRAEAIKRARDAGWTYDEVKGDGREICPNCPVYRSLN